MALCLLLRLFVFRLLRLKRFSALTLFFFQPEDGIRDVAVTGVQTCAVPISWAAALFAPHVPVPPGRRRPTCPRRSAPASKRTDRKSTRLNSSHGYISYAVFCLKKKKKKYTIIPSRKKAKNHAQQHQ